MKLTKNIYQIALGYVISSIFLGPLLFVFVSSFAPGPIGDCGDDQWGSRSLMQRAAIIHHYFLITQIGEGIMFGIGLVILILLIAGNWRGKPQSIFLLCGVLLMVAGYGVVIWALSGHPCGFIQ